MLFIYEGGVLLSKSRLVKQFRRLVSANYSPDISEKQWRDIWINFFNPIKKYTHPDDYKKT